MLNVKYFFCNPYRERAYVAWDSNNQGVIVDPGFWEGEIQGLYDFLDQNRIIPKAILLTHTHFDHVYGVADIKRRFDIPIYIGKEEKTVKDGMKMFSELFSMPVPDMDWDTEYVSEGDIIPVGEASYEVIHTPGHSYGSVCYLDRKHKQMFTGDTLFAGSIGRTDLPWSDYDVEIVSIMEKIIWLDGDIEIHPGHGGSSSIGYERTHNPFLQPFNEKDEATGAVDGVEFNE